MWNANFLSQFSGCEPVTVQMICQQAVNPIAQSIEILGIDDDVRTFCMQTIRILQSFSGRAQICQSQADGRSLSARADGKHRPSLDPKDPLQIAQGGDQVPLRGRQGL